MPSGQEPHIEQILDRAGRDAQPRGRGWDELPARLAGTPQVRGWPISVLPALAGVAAMIAVVIGVGLYLSSGPAVLAQDAPVRVVRQDVAVTVFNEFESEGPTLFTPVAALRGQVQRRRHPVRQGMALVRDHRIVMNLRAGDNVVRFTDVAATIDPTSVRFVSDTDPLGTQVVEQNFEFDLATAGALLERYLDRKVTCVAKDGESFEGYLCSHDDASIVLADRPPREDGGDRKTQTITRADLRAIRLADVPDDLVVKPTLVWTIRTQRPGKHDTTLTYLCGDVKWQADYVLVITPGDIGSGDRLGLQGWVTIDNRSGSTYEDAGLKLIAGDVHRVVDPWAPQPPPVPSSVGDHFYAEVRYGYAFGRAAKAFVEKSFFEYHLYTLSAPSTIRDQQIKQLRLLDADDISAMRRYVFDPQVDDRRVAVKLEFRNEEDNHLGRPLPKGRVRMMQRDHDGEMQLIGQADIDHTPKDEEMKLHVGYAFDVAATRVHQDTQKPAEKVEIQTIDLRMRKHKAEPIAGRFVEHLQPGRNWRITESTIPWQREDVNTVNFDFVLGADDEKQITYVVEYRW